MRQSATPLLLEELIKITIRDLKRFKFFKGSYKSGSLSVKDNFGNIIASFTLTVFTGELINSYTWFDYEINGKPYTQQIPLTYIKSNLGKGMVPYFYFPATNKRYRVLYFYKTEFVPKDEIPETYFYENQTLSKRIRGIDSLSRKDKKRENVSKELTQAFATRMYNGRITRKMKQLIQLNKQLAY